VRAIAAREIVLFITFTAILLLCIRISPSEISFRVAYIGFDATGGKKVPCRFFDGTISKLHASYSM
jgi:hypothetical protein